MIVLQASGLVKTYNVRPPVHALQGLDFQVEQGERVAVIGRSGAGKSTLLNILGLLDEPTSGSYELLGHATHTVTSAERDRLRAQHLGFVFQENHILGHRTVYQNVELKLSIAGVPRRERRALATSVLTQVGLEHRIDSLGRLLSGGEKQRLAVARAVITGPQVLFADEPTGNLDRENADTVLELFDIQARAGVSVIVITHDLRIAEWADRTLTLDAGRLNPTATTPA